MSAALSGPDEALRAEHDAIAARLTARRSIDHVRRGAWAAFLALLSGGLAGGLALQIWGTGGPRRWPGSTALFWAALAAGAVGFAVAASAFARARRLMRREDQDFARLLELRYRLEIDP